MELVNFPQDLHNCTDDIPFLRKVINFTHPRNARSEGCSFKERQNVLARILEIFSTSKETDRERILLASHAFFALLSQEPNDDSNHALDIIMKNLLQLNSHKLSLFDKEYTIAEVESFKLLCAYGYLQANHCVYSNDVLLLVFEILYENCIKYTKYSHFACRVLHMWLKRTVDTEFWNADDSVKFQQNLESVIFSNWNNAINEISKQNSTSIFNLYLRIMSAKYDGFLNLTFNDCLDNISWQNETKYTILSEICEVWDNKEYLTSFNFLLSLSTALTKNSLRCGGTKVYTAISKKLSEDEWKIVFGPVIDYLFKEWELPSKYNESALQTLCKHWLEPMIRKYKDILHFLWELTNDIEGYFIKSYLQRIAAEMRVTLPNEINIDLIINHKTEFIRLNGFAICCNRINVSFNTEKYIFAIKEFLHYNANCNSVYMRDGITKNFKVFYINLLRACEIDSNNIVKAQDFMEWLLEFLLDCLEIGSSYQRKILCLNLYRTVFSFTNTRTVGRASDLGSARYVMLFEKYIKSSGKWKFTNKESLFLLLRLILDTSSDIRQLATSIILEFFDRNILNDAEMQTICKITLEHSNSSKFYKIDSGAALFTLLAHWLPFDIFQNSIIDKKNVCFLRYSEFLLHEATEQLAEIQDDLLKATVEDKPFYGALTALLNIAFQNGPEKVHLTLEFVEKTLQLAEDATEFFLSVLSSKSKYTEYSSSFAEMGLAIDEAIKSSAIGEGNYDELNLTPAHQVLISCIWMSLKVACEVACEIGSLMYSDETVKRSANLIVTILFRCRHKGVVESAGKSIGNLTRVLCREPKYSEIPKSQILNILKPGSKESINITRRGAGLSIMFHRIVMSDNRRDRPILHFALQLLLDSLDHPSEIPTATADFQETDSPIARWLHFLRTLVADKEIHPQLISYMQRISFVCFKYLQSEIWTIRNASLQLFGAVVPRLAGQSYGDSLDYGNGYSINHFRTHYPLLAEYALTKLKEFVSQFETFFADLCKHSSIVHILILLSKFSYTDCALVDLSSRSFVQEVTTLLRRLFAEPVYYVRLLAVKAYAALTPFSRVKNTVLKLKSDISYCTSNNAIHGHLLAIKYLTTKFQMETMNVHIGVKESLSNSSLTKMDHDLTELIKIQRPSYVLKALILEFSKSSFCYKSSIFPFNQYLLSTEIVQPGFSEFVDNSMRLYAEYVKRSEIVNREMIEEILSSLNKDHGIVFLRHLIHFPPILPAILEHILSIDIPGEELYLNEITNFVLNTLRHMISSTFDESKFERIVNQMKLEIKQDELRTPIRRLKSVLLLLFSEDQTVIHSLLLDILNLSIQAEEHTKEISSEFLEFAMYRFARFTNANKLLILHASIILLKDEITEIREKIAESLRAHILSEFNIEFANTLHEEIIYQKLLHVIMLNNSFSEFRIENLRFLKLFLLERESFNSETIIENPFCHDDSTVHREDSKFLNACFLHIEKGERIKGNDVMSIIQAKYCLQERIEFNCTDLLAVLTTKYADYLLRKQRVVINTYTHNI